LALTASAVDFNRASIKLDRRLFAGLCCGFAMFMAAYLTRPPPRPRPDFSDVHIVEGRLFCTSYLGRNGSSFRIDDVSYLTYGGGNCNRQQHGFDGPRVRASWVRLPGAESRRLLMTAEDLQTGRWILYLRPDDVERAMTATDDPYEAIKLVSAVLGIVVIVASLAAAHARGEAAATRRLGGDLR
jgi:hypothetical protein